MQRLQLAHCRALAWTDVLQLLRTVVASRTRATDMRERCRVAVPVQRRSIPRTLLKQAETTSIESLLVLSRQLMQLLLLLLLVL